MPASRDMNIPASTTSGPSRPSKTYALPQLPIRAKAPVDHLGFRRQGTRAVKERIETLEMEIGSLDEAEVNLRFEQVKLSDDAQKLVNDAHSIFVQACERHYQLPTPELKEILTKVSSIFNILSTRWYFLKSLEATVVARRGDRDFDDMLPHALQEIQERLQEEEVKKVMLESALSKVKAGPGEESGKPANKDENEAEVRTPVGDELTEIIEMGELNLLIRNEAITHYNTMEAALNSSRYILESQKKNEKQREETYKVAQQQKSSHEAERVIQKRETQQRLQRLWTKGQHVIRQLQLPRKAEPSVPKQPDSPATINPSSAFRLSQHKSSAAAQAGISAFGQSGASAFGQAEASSFGSAGTSSFGQAGASPFGQSGSSTPAQSSSSAFGQPASSATDQSGSSAFGKTSAFSIKSNLSGGLFGEKKSFFEFHTIKWWIESSQGLIWSRSAEESLSLTTLWSNPFYKLDDWELPLLSVTEAVEKNDVDQIILLVQHHYRRTLRRMLLNSNVLQVFVEHLEASYAELFDLYRTKRCLQDQLNMEKEWLRWQEQHQWTSNEDRTGSGYGSSRIPGLPTYQYEDLKGKDFRVLVLLPAPDPSYPLLCRVETWSMEIPHNPYTALSYCWGSEDYTGHIFLLPSYYEDPDQPTQQYWGSAIQNATPMPIRDNLFRALLRFRASGPDAQPTAVWVDSVCINQGNINEKTQQLGRMAEIYSKADNVSVWLGEADEEERSAEAMEFVTSIMDFAWLDRHSRDKNMAHKWYALGELMRDPWFSRRWVVQEIALAREATVRCGGSVVSWSDFADAASILVSGKETIKLLFDTDWREGPDTLGEVNSFGAAVLLDSIHNLFLRGATGDIKRPIKNLESLVTSLTTFFTGDPRDLVYSLVSIAQDTSYHVWRHGNPRPEEPRLIVDYNQSVIEVYKNFTEFCVLTSKSLNIICRPWALPTGGDEELPSWVPLLTTSEYGVAQEGYRGRKNGEGLVGLEGSARYDASAGLESQARFKSRVLRAESAGITDTSTASVEGAILVARGFILGRITDVSARRSGGVILREALRMGGWTGLKPGTTSVPDTIWRTLVADRDENGKVPPSWYKRACLRCLEVADRDNDGDLNIGETLHRRAEMLRRYLTRVRNVTRNRRFFTADRQGLYPGEKQSEVTSYFGLCPPETKTGDLICILYGCSVPVVLREDEGGYVRLIGESYVHGMMDGEAVVEFNDNKWLGKEFHIR